MSSLFLISSACCKAASSAAACSAVSAGVTTVSVAAAVFFLGFLTLSSASSWVRLNSFHLTLNIGSSSDNTTASASTAAARCKSPSSKAATLLSYISFRLIKSCFSLFGSTNFSSCNAACSSRAVL